MPNSQPVPSHRSARALAGLLLGLLLAVAAPAAPSVFDLNVVGYERVVRGDLFDGYSFTDSYELSSAAQAFEWEPGDTITLRISAPAGQAFFYQPSGIPPTGISAELFPSGLGRFKANLFGIGPGFSGESPSFLEDPTQEFLFGENSFGPLLATSTTLIGGFYTANTDEGSLQYVYEAGGLATSLLFDSLIFTAKSSIGLAGDLRFVSSDEGDYPLFSSWLAVDFQGRPEDYPDGAPSFLLVPVPEPATSAAWLGLVAAFCAALRRRSRA